MASERRKGLLGRLVVWYEVQSLIHTPRWAMTSEFFKAKSMRLFFVSWNYFKSFCLCFVFLLITKLFHLASERNYRSYLKSDLPIWGLILLQVWVFRKMARDMYNYFCLWKCKRLPPNIASYKLCLIEPQFWKKRRKWNKNMFRNKVHQKLGYW